MNPPIVENTGQDSALRQAAERVLSSTLKKSVYITTMTRLTEPDRRSAIYRLSVGGDTYIIKKSGSEAYSYENLEARETVRFFNDWVGAEFLSGISASQPVGPRFFGGDPNAGFFIIEDLGEHRSLVEPLLEGNADSASVSLMKYVTCIGKLHAMTAGKSAAFDRLYGERLPGAKPFAYEKKDIQTFIDKMKELMGRFEVVVTDSLAVEIDSILGTLAVPGPFNVFIHADACPDNLFDVGERFRLIDFETSHYGHALLDGVYPRMMFPTCWCANRLPADLVTRLEARYREELVVGCPEAKEDPVWETALTNLCGFTLLDTLGDIDHVAEKDHDWGIATVRQRILTRLEAFILTADEFKRLPSLRGVASLLLPKLQAAWPETSVAPVYPAFRIP